MYFQTTQANIAGNPHLRESQIQAYLELKGHFDSGDKRAAIVVLPTGTGKTGLMAIAPFALAEKRVLIVAPGLVIKRGVTKDLDPSSLGNFWLKRRVLLSPKKLPTLVEYTADVAFEDLEKAQFVVANIHMTQAQNTNSILRRVPRDFFDMVIIDEAHHSPAQSWVELEQYFAGAKVLKLTGTPFRSDLEPITGKYVYTYELGRAMSKKYIKRLIRETWLPEELTFKIQDDGGFERVIPYEEAIKLKDSEWVSRSVAYSTECSRTVVKNSLAIMQEKRQATGRPHKIIAVAQNIDHAVEIKGLYEEAGASATIVASRWSNELNEANLLEFINDRAQVVVNVGMLGEGFDHPLISVAALFRPFRTLLPYAQFAGRALRAIEDGNDIDNTAHLVHHKALGLDDLWEYYRKEEYRSNVIDHLEHVAQEEAAETPGTSRQVDWSQDVVQAGELEVQSSSYLDHIDVIKAYDEALAEGSKQAQLAAEALKAGGFTVTPTILEAIMAEMNEATLKEKRPELVRRERRKRLTQLVQDGIANILTDQGLDGKEDPEPYVWPNFAKFSWLTKSIKTLDGFLVALVNSQLKDRIGRPREQWSTQDYERAEPIALEFLCHLELLFKKGED